MQTGWLDPAGNFYPCETFEHYDVAVVLVDRLFPEIMDERCEDDILKERGWVQITRSLIGKKEQSIYWDRFLTEYQKQFLRQYFEENDEPISLASKMKWEREINAR